MSRVLSVRIGSDVVVCFGRVVRCVNIGKVVGLGFETPRVIGASGVVVFGTVAKQLTHRSVEARWWSKHPN
jgi:hypothetical protein